jgi:putative transposase
VLIRNTGITGQIHYSRKAEYTDLELDQVRQIRQHQEENTKLKQLVAERTFDKTVLQEVLSPHLA